jgi:hypothetical protein
MMGLISFADRSRDAQMDLVYERVFKLESIETLAGKSFPRRSLSRQGRDRRRGRELH